MIHVLKTGAFSKWFDDVSDVRAKARIQIRIDRISLGLIGDAKFFDGIGELRIDYGPGYRVYFVRHGRSLWQRRYRNEDRHLKMGQRRLSR